MLYIINLVFISLWATYIIRKGHITWHAVISIFCIALTIVDIIEIIFNLLLEFYKFPTHLLNNDSKSNLLGIMFTDSIILPLTAIIFCHYASKMNPWTITILFTLMHGFLEWVYLSLDFLTYRSWSIWYSVLIYAIGFRVAASFAVRLIHYRPPVAYSIKLFCFIYSITAVGGGVLGALMSLYQWRLGVFKKTLANDRFADLGLSLVIALLAIIVLKIIHQRYRIWTLIVLPAFMTLFWYYTFKKGWLIYYHWNHELTALRWFIPLLITIWYDDWERKFIGIHK